ncbi:MAG: hypothetical protein ACRD5H_14820, partial [Nitrososphaerales archaeon]
HRSNESGFTPNVDNRVKQTGKDSKSYSDTDKNLKPYTTYYYKVAAVDSSNNIGEYGEASATTLKEKPMRGAHRRLLLAYFVSIIIVSSWLLVSIWPPAGNSPPSSKVETYDTRTPAQNQTITIITNSTGKAYYNKTDIKLENNGTQTITILNFTAAQPGNITLNTLLDVGSWVRDPGTRQILIAMTFGLLGSSVHGISSLAEWFGHCRLTRKWTTWYIARPPIGMALAVISYMAIRAGYVSGDASDINDIGVAAIGGLVGLMTDQVADKLRDVLDSLFGRKKKEEQKADGTNKTEEKPTGSSE